MKFTRRYADRPASAGWVLAFNFAGVATFSGTCTTDPADADGFLVTIAATTTASLAAGVYQYLATATLNGERYSVDSGSVTLLPNVATATDGALQSHAEKMLPIVRAEIAARLGTGTGAGHESYTIDGRAIQKFTLDELQLLEHRLAWRLWREQHPGQLGPRRQVRFVG